MKYCCCTPRRLAAVAEAKVLNGISFLEVSDKDAPTFALRQRTLFVHLLLPPGGLNASNVVIDGGVRYPTVGVLWAAPGDALPPGESPALLAEVDDPSLVLVVRTDGTGDHSRYTLHLVGGGTSDPPPGFDPQLATIDFSFKVECPSDFDCQQDCFCPPTAEPGPPISYLAKDYDSFRQLMLDRISLLAPGSVDPHAADLGMALVELLAYVADQQSYRQDAIATEAYLGTARSRISLRRHARLVDYQVSEGCNARAFVQVLVSGPAVPVPAGTRLLTSVPGLPSRVSPADPALQAVLASGEAEVFETVDDALLDESLSVMHLWTWGDLDCCLPVGSTSATLRGAFPTLRADDVIVLTEAVSPTTGQAADADPAHRVAVRLTSVVVGSDPSGGRFANPPTNNPQPITSIRWDPADALTFPLCVSADGGNLEVARALGNIVLADHGQTVPVQQLGPVPSASLPFAPSPGCACAQAETEEVPVRFRPELAAGPLTFAAPAGPGPLFATPVADAPIGDLTALQFTAAVQEWLAGHGQILSAGTPAVQGMPGSWSVSDGATVLRLTIDGTDLVVTGRQPPAAAALLIAPRTSVPALSLVEQPGDLPWTAQQDLLGSDGFSRDFVVEVETGGMALLRFGDGQNGQRPPDGAVYLATYRVGNGQAGNVGAAAIAHVVSDDSGLVGVANPMPAAGGVDPETTLAIRRDAPQAFEVQERAVTEADYATVSAQNPAVAQAAATFRWTGSWYTAFVTADRSDGLAVDQGFEADLAGYLDYYRMAGLDLEVNGPVLVPLKIDLFLCVDPSYLRADVLQSVLARLGSGVGPDGVPGLFHPSRLAFGRPVYLSAVYATAQQVPGVQSVTVDTFARLFDDAGTGLRDGVLPMSRLELAQCANDPDFPDHGVLTITAGGGR